MPWTEKPVLVLGTRNAKKRLELECLLAPHRIRVRNLEDFPRSLEIEETGSTFAENARLKAAQQAAHLRHWVLGEDSGLSVRALGGEPGVYSARYAGLQASDAENNEKLLSRLNGVPLADRQAWYTCHVALADPQGQLIIECSGTCQGRILTTYRGQAGFGYDPLFEITEYHQTFGELGLAVKSVISHRARAIRAFLKQLLKLPLFA